ncbi:hypothetical protein CMQ_792 [Grosmannia clavigera kw1407]|uniref:Post-SET domain-containing protein n=1 Tax=Grosmannia clavigera (strain kw1407 / UAMH 11150) TaxID=655863 RepID=F0XD53_GROCL|nr:uncharacterized protein CMQ_792 [Grosmannia clavigera kw1407]EFX03864.1 hypothetical protein CMQ_792 [Grosmannia clavigera kw1407]
MAPLKPHWKQPSHPDIQEVLVAADGDNAFTTKSISRIELPPFALFARLSSPPCTPAAAPTYATVQVSRDRHINLNSDLLYINHSCEPSLIFDTAGRAVWVGPKGLRPGDELTFFYPSTEWDMAQPFSCFCGTATCRGQISGARSMRRDQLAGLWLNAHIWDLLGEQAGDHQEKSATVSASPTELALEEILAKTEETLRKADEAAETARFALATYRHSGNANGTNGTNGHHYGGAADDITTAKGATRRGPTSRELSGEMGGDTVRT